MTNLAMQNASYEDELEYFLVCRLKQPSHSKEEKTQWHVLLKIQLKITFR